MIFNRNARTLHARARFSVRMRGCFTREHDFPRECEDAPRESAIFNENDRFFLHRGPPTLYVGPPFSPLGLLFYYFTISTMYAISSKNARTLHARARFSTRMRGRSTRERDFQPECADAPRESVIFNRKRRRFTRERYFPRECEEASRESAFFNENEKNLASRTANLKHPAPGLHFLHLGPPTLNIRQTPSIFCISDRQP